ncbi:MAG: hypothetical protein WKF47_15135 [Geodermatophilaceae bacterium]
MSSVRSDGAVAAADLAVLWPGIEQRERALAGLVTDGLVVPVVGGYALRADRPRLTRGSTTRSSREQSRREHSREGQRQHGTA